MGAPNGEPLGEKEALMSKKTDMDNPIREADQISESDTHTDGLSDLQELEEAVNASRDIFLDHSALFGHIDPLTLLSEEFDDADAVSYSQNGKAFALVKELLQKKDSETWEADEARVFDEINAMYERKEITFDELNSCIFALGVADDAHKLRLKSA